MDSIISLQALNRSRVHFGSGFARSSFKSCPAQNAGPAPASTTTLIEESSLIRANSAEISAIPDFVRAFRAFGLFKVSVAMPFESVLLMKGSCSALVICFMSCLRSES